jgi:hypothetical protein
MTGLHGLPTAKGAHDTVKTSSPCSALRTDKDAKSDDRFEQWHPRVDWRNPAQRAWMERRDHRR